MIRSTLMTLLLCGASLGAPAQEAFPKVDPATQRERDAQRREILETELAAERTAYAAAQAALASAPTEANRAALHRSDENIKALLRELGAGIARRSPLRVAAAPKPQKQQEATGAVPFWDPYRRASAATDLSTTSKELP